MNVCTICHIGTHRKYLTCSRCRGTVRSKREIQDARFWRPCLAVAGEYVLRAMKDRRTT
jgi:hypothetical protein